MSDFSEGRPRCRCVTPMISTDGSYCYACGHLMTIERVVVSLEAFDDIPTPVEVPVGRAPKDTKAAEKLIKSLVTAPQRAVLLDSDDPERTCDVLVRHLSRGTYDPETPGRMARALEDLTSGYLVDDFAKLLKTFPIDDTSADHGIVAVRGIPFASLCEHHVLPFVGVAHVAYIPRDRIVGVSKVPRLVRAVSRRLQVQERIGVMVADALMTHVSARGAMVVIRAQHSCMAIRGAECPAEMVTSTVRGVFRDTPEARAEALELFR